MEGKHLCMSVRIIMVYFEKIAFLYFADKSHKIKIYLTQNK